MSQSGEFLTFFLFKSIFFRVLLKFDFKQKIFWCYLLEKQYLVTNFL